MTPVIFENCIMASLNKVQIIGNMGQDPEVRFIPNGTAVSTFSLATSERWTDKAGQKQEKTEWHRCEVWGQQAEFIGEYAKKGSQIYVEGSLTTEKYTDKDGVERYTTKVKAQSVQLLDRRNAGQSDDGDNHDDRAAAPAPAPRAAAPAPRASAASAQVAATAPVSRRMFKSNLPPVSRPAEADDDIAY